MNGFLEAVLAAEAILGAAGGVYLAHRARTERGLFWVAMRDSGVLAKHRCAACGGLGVVWVMGGEERVIPPHLRDRQADHYELRPRIASTRRCRFCHGMGFTWVRRREGTLGHGSPPPVP